MIDLIQEIYGTIKRNKLRTFLTGFAVAWGIFMLIVLLGAGNGLINAFESNAGGRALNSMKVYPGWTNKPFDGLKEGRSIKLTEKDMEITGNFKDNVTAVGATIEQSSVNLSYGEDHVSLLLEGVTPEYLHIDAISIKTGRFINAPDIKEKRKVILLHEKTVEMLFGKQRCKCHRKVCKRQWSGLPSNRSLYRYGQLLSLSLHSIHNSATDIQ